MHSMDGRRLSPGARGRVGTDLHPHALCAALLDVVEDEAGRDLDRLDDPSDQLFDTPLPFGRTDLPAEVLRDDDVGRLL